MQYSSLATVLKAGVVRCDACQWRCALAWGDVGRCAVRHGDGTGVVPENYGMISGAATGPVEDHRLWHFFPDSLAFSVGSWGSSFPADQGRSPYALLPDQESKRRKLDPDRIATFALERMCRGVVWAYGEPAVSFDYVYDVLRLARASSRYTAIVTSGYLTEQALDHFGPYLDGMSLELRAFDDASYARLTGVSDWRGILNIAARARQHWNCHVEVTTRLHHGVNTGPDELRALIGWVRDTLGPQTPWHVLPGDVGAESAAAVARARRTALEEGLQFVYGPELGQPTRCPQCASEVITRDDGVTRITGVRDGLCANCEASLGLRTSIFKKA